MKTVEADGDDSADSLVGDDEVDSAKKNGAVSINKTTNIQKII